MGWIPSDAQEVEACLEPGIPVSRGALGHWVIASSERHLDRIYDALKLRLRSQEVVHGDETTVQVLKEEGKAPAISSYMWAYRSSENSEQPIVLLDYHPGRGQEHPQAFLGDYRGILMSDGYTAWRTLKGATHLGCMAHARRRFADALKARKKRNRCTRPTYSESLLMIRLARDDEESFNGSLRDELLNEELFDSLADARRKLAIWRYDYNHVRPNSSLGNRTPAQARRAFVQDDSITPDALVQASVPEYSTARLSL